MVASLATIVQSHQRPYCEQAEQTIYYYGDFRKQSNARGASTAYVVTKQLNELLADAASHRKYCPIKSRQSTMTI